MPRLTPKQQEIAGLMADGETRTGVLIFIELGGGRSKAGTTAALRALVNAGVLVAEEVSPGVPYSDFRYRLAPAPRGEDDGDC